MSERVVQSVVPLGFPWTTFDPFLFCVHHDDAYPRGTEAMGPDPSLLRGRSIGMDFEGIDGWRMYHGDVVPGFPRHPHRGFETVTVMRDGYIDHSDSLGATARFGRGDVQWLTAGAGIVHCEMFPLLDPEGPNPLELFQIWLNLPAADKMVDPYFTMFWDTTIPRVHIVDDAGRTTTVTVVAGQLEGEVAPAPPPDSWASKSHADVAIWHVVAEAQAVATLPPAQPGTVRSLYVFEGEATTISDARSDAPGVRVDSDTGVVVDGERPLTLRDTGEGSEVLVLQGRPIGDPVAQYGPFVMNTRAEIEQAVLDYQRGELVASRQA